MTVPYLASLELLRERVASFEEYPYSIAALRNLTTIDFQSPVTFFVGENGTGKSTLLEAIAIVEGFNPEGGTRNFSFATRESHSDLHNCLRLSRTARRMGDRDGFFYRAESFFNAATQLEKAYYPEPEDLVYYQQAYGDRLLHEQSHGESFFELVLNRFRGNGLYLLDEPESALSPPRELSFLVMMRDLIAEDSQFIIATHSPILLGYPGAQILEFGADSIRRVAYEDTEHYKVTKAFLTRHEQMTAELFREQ